MKAKILKRFEDEVAGLERELKMELPKEIQRARELGDLRENAEYQAAKERQTYVQALAQGLGTKAFFATLRAIEAAVNAFAPRWALQDIWHAGDASKRQQLQKEKLQFITATAAGKATVEETPHTIRYTQALDHPRLKWATRRLEVWKREPRARLTFRLNRISSFDPELLCVVNPLPCDGLLPRVSSGGLGFTLFTDQFPGTCRDYFAIDGWAHYATAADGHWLWVTRDVPLVTFDAPHPKSHLAQPPGRTGRVLAIAFDNFWYTNFQGDSPGVMEFQFDLLWRREIAGDPQASQLADALVSEPVMVLNPSIPEHPLFMKHLDRFAAGKEGSIGPCARRNLWGR